MGLFNPSRRHRRSTSTALSFSELQRLKDEELRRLAAEARRDEPIGTTNESSEPEDPAQSLAQAEAELRQAHYAADADQPRLRGSGDLYTAASYRPG